LASIHGTVSTILAAVSIAPCSPCMNWLRLAFSVSTPNAVSSRSPHEAIGDPGTCVAARASCRIGAWLWWTRASGSTSVAQSRSVTLFHCDPLALS
jgi:hypothetical protein